jgi:NAD(P)-dependent dehydrogenase (short-subunit alcohol dehydrogenase family)
VRRRRDLTVATRSLSRTGPGGTRSRTTPDIGFDDSTARTRADHSGEVDAELPGQASRRWQRVSRRRDRGAHRLDGRPSRLSRCGRSHSLRGLVDHGDRRALRDHPAWLDQEHPGLLASDGVAGWDRAGPFADTDEELWDRVIAINYRGHLAVCYAALPYMRERGGDRIVTVASDAGRVGSSAEVVYSGAKGAVIAFTKGLAREAARDGINVNCVAPGLVDTPLLTGIAEGNEKLIAAIVRSIPLRRTGVPEESRPPSVSSCHPTPPTSRARP